MSAPLPPLPWVVHVVTDERRYEESECVLVGVFETRTDLLRAMTRKIFGHDDELLVHFCLGLALDVDVSREAMDAFIYQGLNFEFGLAQDLIMNRASTSSDFIHPYFTVSSIGDEFVRVDDENKMLRARDVFRGMPFTMPHDRFDAVARWVSEGTVAQHLAILAWFHVAGKRNGFEGRVNSRVAGFLV